MLGTVTIVAPMSKFASKTELQAKVSGQQQHLSSQKRPSSVAVSSSLVNSTAVSDLKIRKADKPTTEATPSVLSTRWREIQGSNEWKGLLEHPVDPCLRAELVRYGEFAQACYDTYDNDAHSKYCGSSKFGREEFFEKLELPGRGYEVTRFLYATADPEIPLFFKRSEVDVGLERDATSNWIGYVAVATDEKEIARLGRRDIVIAWRGTVTSTEWVENMKDFLSPAGLDERHTGKKNFFQKLFEDEVKIESGFLHLYTSVNKDAPKNRRRSAREQLLWEIHRLVGLYAGEQLSITLTGHSLGGALALLSAYDIAESGMNEPVAYSKSESYDMKKGLPTGSLQPIFNGIPRPHNIDDDPKNNIPVTVFSFAAPRVGNNEFRDRCHKLGVKVLRIVNTNDAVPRTPGMFVNEKIFNKLHYLQEIIDDLPWTYIHVGQELQISSSFSPFLQSGSLNLANHHNLEAHLHILDGYHGPNKSFYSVSNRDLALVNKASDFLMPKLGLPASWWQDLHKGLVKDTVTGRRIQPERDEHSFGDDDDQDL